MYKTNLDENDDRPVVVSYLRVSPDPESNEPSLGAQHVSIKKTCEQRFPQGFHLFIVAEEASGDLSFKHEGLAPGEYRPGLTTLAELIACGAVQHVCISQLNRLSTSLIVWQEFAEGYLLKNRVTLTVSAELSRPDHTCL